MEVWFIYLVSVTVALVAVYAAIRSIDYGFTKAEDKRRCNMAKATVRCFTGCQRIMAKDLIKSINDNLFDMAKKYEDL